MRAFIRSNGLYLHNAMPLKTREQGSLAQTAKNGTHAQKWAFQRFRTEISLIFELNFCYVF